MILKKTTINQAIWLENNFLSNRWVMLNEYKPTIKPVMATIKIPRESNQIIRWLISAICIKSVII